MAIARDAYVGTLQYTTGTSLTYSHTCTGSNLALLVCVEIRNGDICTGVTYNGVSMTQLTKVARAIGSPAWYYYHYGLLNPATGANNIVISSSASAFIGSKSVSYTGVKQNGLPDAAGSTANTAADISLSITTVAANCIIFAWGLCDNGFSGGGDGHSTGLAASFSYANGDAMYESSSFPIVSPGSYSMTVLALNASSNNQLLATSLAPAVASNGAGFFLMM